MSLVPSMKLLNGGKGARITDHRQAALRGHGLNSALYNSDLDQKTQFLRFLYPYLAVLHSQHVVQQTAEA